MPIKTLLAALSVFFFLASPAFSEGETIVTHEVSRYFYKDGRILKLEGQFEMTYLLDLDKNTLLRTRVYDFINKKITPDETVYHIERQLLSHPTNADRYVLKPLVRGSGQTGADSLEMIIVEEGFVDTVSSNADELVLSHARRVR